MSAPGKSVPRKRRENEVLEDVAVRAGDGSCGLVRQQETAQGHDIPDLGAFGFDSCQQRGDLGIADLPQPVVIAQRAGRIDVKAQASSAPQTAGIRPQAHQAPYPSEADTEDATAQAEDQRGNQYHTTGVTEQGCNSPL